MTNFKIKTSFKFPSENPTKKRIYPDFCNRYEQIDDKNIKTAVTLWVDEKAAALSKYGHISDWDTSSITNMDNLFLRKSNFNDNVSGWDTSGVTTMKVCVFLENTILIQLIIFKLECI